MRIFRQCYTDKKTGRTRESSKWYVEFRDHLRIVRRWPAFEAKNLAERFGRRLEQLVECRRAGDGAPTPDLLEWLMHVPADLRKRMGDAGLIDPRRLTADRPLVLHLDGRDDATGDTADVSFRASLAARGNSAEYVELTVGRVRRVLVDGVGAATWADVARPGGPAAIANHLATLRAAGEIRGQTFAYYVKALRQFGDWMVRNAGVPANALDHLEAVRDTVSDGRPRRALSLAELAELIAYLDHSAAPEAYGLAAADRSRLYRFAYDTGLRPGTIRALTVTSFDLDADPPTVTGRAATVKRRKAHTQVLRPAMAAELRVAFATKVPTAAAFAMPDKFTCAEMLRADLAGARAQWVGQARTDKEAVERQKSDFLADVDHDGLRADFYSLRHSHGTALGDAGVPQKDIAGSLHHAKTSTTDRYVHSGRDARRAALAALPEIKSATGTDGKGVDDRAAYRFAYRAGRAEAGSGGSEGEQKTAFPGGKRGLISEGDGTRTRNHRIDSPVL